MIKSMSPKDQTQALKGNTIFLLFLLAGILHTYGESSIRAKEGDSAWGYCTPQRHDQAFGRAVPNTWDAPMNESLNAQRAELQNLPKTSRSRANVSPHARFSWPFSLSGPYTSLMEQ